MEREVEINSAAHKYSKKDMSKNFVEAKVDFMEGAKWADSNPAWHKYPVEKPTEEKWYIICCADNREDIDFWDYDGWCNAEDYHVIAWMELPKPPKFD